MIELHQYPAAWGLPSLSPFCVKIELFLKRARLPYRSVVERNPSRGPKGRMPFIRDLRPDGERIVADSSFIVDYLVRTYDLGALLPDDPVATAQGLAFQRLIEESLYFVLLYSRWIDPVGWQRTRRDFGVLFPPLVRRPILSLIRRELVKQTVAQGLGEHSASEIYGIGRKNLEALSDFLGKKPFLLGGRWTAVDATLGAFLSTILTQPIESQLKTDLESFANLVSYSERQMREGFP